MTVKRLIPASAAAALACLLSACGGPPAGPSTPAPVIACPAAQSVVSPAGESLVVTYPDSIVAGGAPPVWVTCTPPSGTAMGVGANVVSCTARDAKNRISSCQFTVDVIKAPVLSATRFLAFGDSITSGVLATSCPPDGGVACPAPSASGWASRLQGLRALLFGSIGEESPAAYPRVVQLMLASRYVGQSVTVFNEGSPGEPASSGKSRLLTALSQRNPEVLLLLQGTVDVSAGAPDVAALVEDLRSMIHSARSRGVTVLLGTLLPQRPNACRGYDFCDGVVHVDAANAQIRAMAASEGALLVDLHQAFSGQTATLLGLDGLHPNEAGYTRMAEIFFDAIRAHLENP